MQMSNKGMIALARREAIVLPAYKDSVGVWTIGVGHTAAAGGIVPRAGLKITLAEAIALFRLDVMKYEDAVNRAVLVPLKQHEFDALVSWHYNTGGAGRSVKKYKGQGWSGVIRAINSGDRALTAARLLQWNKPASIISRREGEVRQFLTGDYGDTSRVLVYRDRYPGRAELLPTGGLFSGVPNAPDRPAPTTPAPKPAPPQPASPAAPAGFWARFRAALQKRIVG